MTKKRKNVTPKVLQKAKKLKESFGDKLSQRQLAELIGYSASTICRMEKAGYDWESYQDLLAGLRGGEERQYKRVTPEMVKKAETLYEVLGNATKVAELVGVSAPTIAGLRRSKFDLAEYRKQAREKSREKRQQEKAEQTEAGPEKDEVKVIQNMFSEMKAFISLQEEILQELKVTNQHLRRIRDGFINSIEPESEGQLQRLKKWL